MLTADRTEAGLSGAHLWQAWQAPAGKQLVTQPVGCHLYRSPLPDMLGMSVQVGSLAANKKEVAQLLVGQYDALLSFLKSHGALLNAVKPELLLDIEEFRSGLTAGAGHQSHTKGLPGMTWCAVTQLYTQHVLRAAASL